MRSALRALGIVAGIGALIVAGTLLLSPGPAVPGGRAGPPGGEIRGERRDRTEPTAAAPEARTDARRSDDRAPSPGGATPGLTPASAKKGRERNFGRSLELVTWESIAAEGLPAPPPEFTASPFRWRLKHPIERERMEGFVRQMKILTVEERTALLQRIRRSKDRRFGVVLLAEVPSLPDDPVTIFDYASAMIETAAAPAAGEPPVPPRDLTSAALALLAGRAVKYGSVLEESGWEGVRVKLERLGEVDPSLLRDPASEAGMAEIRRALGAALEKALSREVGYAGGVACFRLAARFGDEGTHEVLARLLKEWDVVRTRFPPGGGAEPTAHLYAVQALLQPPCNAHAWLGVEALVARYQAEPEGKDRSGLAERIRGYRRQGRLPEDLRRRLYDALGDEFPEEEPKREPPPPAPADPEPPRLQDTYR